MEDVKTEVETVEEAVDTVDTESPEDPTAEDDISGVEGYDYEEDDLEYDDDGNVVIPDDDAEADTTAEEGGDPPKEEAPDPRDAEIERLRARNSAIEEQAKNTLKSLGYEGEDVMDGLTRLAAESEGKSHEEYKAAQEAEARAKAAEALLAKQEAEKVLTEDLAAIQAEFKAAAKFNSVADFPNIAKFCEMRDLGLSAVDAFRVAQPDIVAEGVATAARATADSKSHLRSSVPKGAKDTSTTIPKDELEMYRDMYPDMSEKQLTDLYRRATKTQ